MSQLWTIIFMILIAIAFGIATWHDREEQKRQQRKEAAQKQTDKSKIEG
ncbi:MAG: hypothetical protein QOH25_3596 [Acidobacteriota bacterium]|jgi:Flp pilus assembly protein TadB|nr:hypothetical protein [Acidobacteriota bacterium]